MAIGQLDDDRLAREGDGASEASARPAAPDAVAVGCERGGLDVRTILPGRLCGTPGVGQQGMTAVVSISTFAPSSISATTCTAAIAA